LSESIAQISTDVNTVSEKDHEIRDFSLGLGIPSQIRLDFVSIAEPSLSNELALDRYLFSNRALNTSPEIRQAQQFIRVIPYVKKEVRYSWLGLAKASRGTAGGIFDGLAINEEVSFGNKWTQENLNLQLKIFRIRLNEVEQTILRQVESAIENYNYRLKLEKLAQEKSAKSDLRLESLLDRLRRGDDKLEIMDIVDAIQDHLESQFALVENTYGFMQDRDRLERLIFQGDYLMTPAETEMSK
jgi:ribosome modulation factor